MEHLKKNPTELSKLKGGCLRGDGHLPGGWDNMVHHHIGVTSTTNTTHICTPCDVTIHTTHIQGLILTDLTNFRPDVTLGGHR